MIINKKAIKVFLLCMIIIVITIFLLILMKSPRNKDEAQVDIVENSDTIPPIIVLDDVYVVKTGYDKNLVEVIMSADDVDPTPKREIIGAYDLNVSGEYNLTYKIEDKSGNITTKDFTLKVKDNYIYSETEISFKDSVDKYKNENTKLGIDVSKWQGEINWDTVAQEGVEFAVIRIGYQKGFDGEILIDPYFEQNINGCSKNNIPIAVYFSSYAKTVEESKFHAKWISEILEKYDCHNINIAFDWENWSSFNKLDITLLDINNIADEFMNECVRLGHKSMLYGSKTYLEKVWDNKYNYPVWLANYVEETKYDNPYKIWQFCQTGLIEGIVGNIDINIMYK